LSDGHLFGLLLWQLFFILLNAVFACAEIAVVAMNDNRLSQLIDAGDRRALKLQKLTEQPSRFFATIQVGITLVNLLSSAVASESFSDKLAAWFTGMKVPPSLAHVLAIAIITILLTYFTVLLGELVPKRIATSNPERIALGMSKLIYVLSKIFAPVVWLFTVSANGILRLIGIDPDTEKDENAEEEIRMILDSDKSKGTIQPEEKDMIQNIFEFDDISAEKIMTHRTEVYFLRLDETDEQWAHTISESKHSIYPVCTEGPDDVIGVLYTKDYFRLGVRNRKEVMSKAVHPAVFVPETIRADALFHKMKQSRNHFAVLIDEYGGTSGIITMNDLLEQLVGEFDDDTGEPVRAKAAVHAGIKI
jgi:putative hemolysin